MEKKGIQWVMLEKLLINLKASDILPDFTTPVFLRAFYKLLNSFIKFLYLKYLISVFSFESEQTHF